MEGAREGRGGEGGGIFTDRADFADNSSMQYPRSPVASAWSGLASNSNSEPVRGLFVCLVAYRPSNMRVYLRDGSAQTILRAATLR